MKKSTFKTKMTMEEMSQAFLAEKPWFVPNKNIVGRFARSKGYRLAKQTINGVQTYFYLKEEE